MKNKLKFLIKTSLKKKIGSKWFKIINIFLAIVIVAIVNLDSIIASFGGDFNKETIIYVIDKTNTSSYNIFEQSFKSTKNMISNNDNVRTVLTVDSEKKVKDKIDNTKNILIVINNDNNNYINADVISNNYLDPVLNQIITSSMNATKASIAYSESNIDLNELAKINSPITINREYLDKAKNSSEENMNTVMSVAFPLIILPSFLLVIILVQTIGAEITEEKTTRGMEIIISNVSPETHLFSKIIASNVFVLIQGGLLILFVLIGLELRNLLGAGAFLSGMSSVGINLNGIWKNLVESGFASKLLYILPLTAILIILSFVAYSLLAGILASMTTSMEDFQQLQVPIMLICLAGYYLSIMAALFEGSVFIKIASYIPFISALLAPALLVIGQVGIFDVFVSILMLILLIYLMLKYGLKVYKVGILNYSSSKLWTKMFKAVRK